MSDYPLTPLVIRLALWIRRVTWLLKVRLPPIRKWLP